MDAYDAYSHGFVVPEWAAYEAEVYHRLSARGNDRGDQWRRRFAELLQLIHVFTSPPDQPRPTDMKAAIVQASHLTLMLRAAMGWAAFTPTPDTARIEPEIVILLREQGPGKEWLTYIGCCLAGWAGDPCQDDSIVAWLLDNALDALAVFGGDLLGPTKAPGAVSGRSRANRPAGRPPASGDTNAGAVSRVVGARARPRESTHPNARGLP